MSYHTIYFPIGVTQLLFLLRNVEQRVTIVLR